MRHEVRRQLTAWLLLAVFVPAVVAAALHVHGDAVVETTCSACVHHQAHAGHLTAAAGCWHDCVLCQLMTSVFTVAAMALLAILVACHHALYPTLEVRVVPGTNKRHGSRAPPVVK